MTEQNDWRKRQETPVQVPLSLACALWDLCCAKGENENAGHLMRAIEAAVSGYFVAGTIPAPEKPVRLSARDSALLFLMRCESRRLAQAPGSLHLAEPLTADIRALEREIETDCRQARCDAVDATR